MSDHDFERQVRQKLNHLKMDPSAKAWENIEEAMRNQRRRRAPFLLTPLLLAGLAAGGFIFYQHGIKNNTAAENKASLLAKKEQSSASTSEIGETSKQPATGIASTNGNAEPKTNNAIVPGNGSGSPVAKSSSVKMLNEDHPARKMKSNTAFISGKENNELTAQQEIKTAPVSTNTRSLPPIPSAVKTLAKPKFDLRYIPEENLKQSTKTANNKIDKKKSSKWSFGLSGYAGMAAVNNGNLLNLDNPKVEDVSSSASTASYRSVNFGRTYNPSTISPGLAFSFGAEAKRELGKRFSISAGLNYTQFNTLSKVGQRINSAQVVNNGPTGYLYVMNYYLLDETQTTVYKNRYHFVELPVSVHYKLNKGALPIYFNGGVVVSQLIQSTSLHFDGTTGVYYKNDRLINQTQAGLTTGLSFALFSKTQRPLWVGPSIRYNISTILKKEVSEDKHFIAVGLDLKLFLR